MGFCCFFSFLFKFHYYYYYYYSILKYIFKFKDFEVRFKNWVRFHLHTTHSRIVWIKRFYNKLNFEIYGVQQSIKISIKFNLFINFFNIINFVYLKNLTMFKNVFYIFPKYNYIISNFNPKSNKGCVWVTLWPSCHLH